MEALTRLEKRTFGSDASGAYDALFDLLDALDAESTLSPSKASRIVSALYTAMVRRNLPPPVFEGLIGRGAILRRVFARSGFRTPSALVGLLTTEKAPGQATLTEQDLEKVLCLASVAVTPAPLLGLIPKLRPQAVLQIAVHLLSDPDLERQPALSAFVLGLTPLLDRLEVSDRLIPALGPAFTGAARFDTASGIQAAIQTSVARWRATRGLEAPEMSSAADGPDLTICAEPLEVPDPTRVVVGPFAVDSGHAEAIRVRPNVADARGLMAQIAELSPRSVEFVGRRTPWWFLLLSQVRWAPEQSSRHVDLHVESTPHRPRSDGE